MTDRSFQVTLTANPADDTHCDDVASAVGRRRDGHCCPLVASGGCPLHDGGLEVDDETSQWVRCQECLAAEKEAKGEP